jgi:hypothetical protein
MIIHMYHGTMSGFSTGSFLVFEGHLVGTSRDSCTVYKGTGCLSTMDSFRYTTGLLCCCAQDT